jgi:hypothetical protein
MHTWEEVKEGPRQLGQAVLADPATIASFTEDDLNSIMLTRIEPGRPCVTYAGFASTLGADFQTRAEWDRYVTDSAARLRAPCRDQTRKTIAAALDLTRRLRLLLAARRPVLSHTL